MIQANQDDPYIWLEDIAGDRAMAWVKARNHDTRQTLAQGASFEASERRLRSIFDSTDRIPHISKAGAYYYNFWQDAEHPRGLWRRTTLDEYRKRDPEWETVLDVDSLARDEKENWVFAYADILEPTYDRCLIALSRGGADAVVVREFDLSAKSFVADGFHLPESKGSASWAGKDELFVARDFGPDTMTESGYPRIVKLWRRGEALQDAALVFEGRRTDVSVGAYATLAPGYETQFVYRGTDFYNTDLFIRRQGALQAVDIPSDATASVHRGRLFVTLDSDWTVGPHSYAAGSLLAADLERFLAGERDLDVLYEPSPGVSLAQYSPTRNHVLVNVLDNVRNRVHAVTPTTEGWVRTNLTEAGGIQTISVRAVDPHADDRYFISTADYTTPSTLSLGSVGGPNTRSETHARDVRRTRPFDHPGVGSLRRRDAHSLFRSAQRERQGPASHAALRLRRFRNLDDTPVLAGCWRHVAGTRLCIRRCQHTRGRRVRPHLAPGRIEVEPPPRVRGLYCGRRRPDRPRDHHAGATGRNGGAATVACWRATC